MSIQVPNGSSLTYFKTPFNTVAKNTPTTVSQTPAQIPTQPSSEKQNKKSDLVKLTGAVVGLAGAVGGIIYAVKKGNANKIEKLAQKEVDKLTTLLKGKQLDVASSESLKVIKTALKGQNPEEVENFHKLFGEVVNSKTVFKSNSTEMKQFTFDFISNKIKGKNNLKEVNHMLKEQRDFFNNAKEYEFMYENAHDLSAAAYSAVEIESRTMHNNTGTLKDTWKSLVKKHFPESEDGLVRPFLAKKADDSPRCKALVSDWLEKVKDLGATRSTKTEIIADSGTHHLYSIDDLYKPGDTLTVTKPIWEVPGGMCIERGSAKTKI